MLEEGCVLLACLALQRTRGYGISLTYKANEMNVNKSLKLCTSESRTGLWPCWVSSQLHLGRVGPFLSWHRTCELCQVRSIIYKDFSRKAKECSLGFPTAYTSRYDHVLYRGAWYITYSITCNLGLSFSFACYHRLISSVTIPRVVGAIAPRVVVKETCGVDELENDWIDRHSGKWVRNLRLRGLGN